MTRFNWFDSTFLLWMVIAALAVWFVVVGVHSTARAADPPPDSGQQWLGGEGFVHGNDQARFRHRDGGRPNDVIVGDPDRSATPYRGGLIYGEKGGPKFDSRGGVIFENGSTRLHTGRNRRDRDADER